MARSYASVRIAIWVDQDWRDLPLPAQWLYLALISQPDLSHAGVLTLAERRWAHLAAETDRGQIEGALKVLTDRRFIVIDEDTEECLVRTYLRTGSGASQQPNTLKTALRAALGVQSHRLRRVLAVELQRLDTSGMRVPASHQPVHELVEEAIEALSSGPTDPPSGPNGVTPSDGYGEGYAVPNGDPIADPIADPSDIAPSDGYAATPSDGYGEGYGEGNGDGPSSGSGSVSSSGSGSGSYPTLKISRSGGERPEANARATRTPPPPNLTAERPPDRCARALAGEHDDTQPCGPCKRARETAEAFGRDQADAEARARAERRAAIDACARCDHNGIALDADGRGYRCHPDLTVVRTEATA